MSADPHALARSIVSESRFQQPKLPRPLHGVLTAVGNAIEKLFHPVAKALGGPVWLWAVLAGLVLAAAIGSALRSARRRRAPRAGGREPAVDVGDGGDDPAALERAAGLAEQRGELGMALRLRFRAGLLRLERADAIELRPGMTSGQIARRLRSERFRALARAFDEVAYGGRPGDERDVQAARSEWPRVLDEARAA